MKQATFYLIENPSDIEGLTAHDALACDLAAMRWREGARVLIACESQQHAERLDEALWQRHPEAFAPHNLAGEGPRFGAPIELCWPEKRGNARRDLLINLQPHFVDFATAFNHVVDFVPAEENLKSLARDRYKAYRSVGFHLTTAPAPTN